MLRLASCAPQDDIRTSLKTMAEQQVQRVLVVELPIYPAGPNLKPGFLPEPMTRAAHEMVQPWSISEAITTPKTAPNKASPLWTPASTGMIVK